MTKEKLKKKPKKEKEAKKAAVPLSESKSAEAEPAPPSYVAGEVSDSLFPKKSNQGTTSLSSLFSTKPCATQPLYVPVVVTKLKRKLPDSDGPKPSKQTLAIGQGGEKTGKAAKKQLSLSKKRVEDREQALANADEEEKGKTTKGKNLRHIKSFDDDDDYELTQQIKKSRIMAEERVKSKRTVFVGNLPAACTKQMLKSCFKEFGAIESMRFRSVARADLTISRKVATIHRDVHAKRKSINAYVVFEEEDSAAKACVRNGTEISSGFHIRVDLASKNSTHCNRKTVFVGNLPYDIEDEALREHFSQCGTVEGVRIIRDKRTGIGKGFGYVLFQGTDSVHLAFKLENSQLMGRKLRIKRCTNSDSKGPQHNGGFRQKLETLKRRPDKRNNTFMGEMADSAGGKRRRPKNKIRKTATKPNKKPNKKAKGKQRHKK